VTVISVLVGNLGKKNQTVELAGVPGQDAPDGKSKGSAGS
jgi:hypothetical protein